MSGNQSNGASPDVILVEVSGLREVVVSGFAALRREQDDVKAWLSRLSGTVADLAAVKLEQARLEQRVTNSDATISDLKLDVETLTDQVSTLDKEDFKHSLFRHGLVGTISAVFGSGMTLVGQFIAHKFGGGH